MYKHRPTTIKANCDKRTIKEMGVVMYDTGRYVMIRRVW